MANSPQFWTDLGVTEKLRSQWESLSRGDYVLFYVSKPVSGVIGYGVVKAKFKQYEPLWPKELNEKRVIWPYRFEFDVEYCLPQDKWEKLRVRTDYILAASRRGLQPISEEEGKKVVQMLVPSPPPPVTSKHEQVKETLLQIGKLQGLFVDSEYDMEGEKIDVIWKKVERGSPTYVFEVQIGGDIHHALTKLMRAYDLWNSNVFLIVTKDSIGKAQELLSGISHQIREKARVIEVEKIEELLKLKKAYKDLERQLGLS